MKISIIIPVYMKERYISRCIKSVLAQTDSSDLECILVDDCGGDDSIRIAKELIAQSFTNIDFSIITHSENKGLPAARNTGLRAAVGEYVLLLDADDELLPCAITEFRKYVQKYPDVDMIIGGLETDNADLEYLDARRYPEMQGYTDGLRNVRRLMYGRMPSTSWNKLMRRSLIMDNGLLQKEGIVHEDFEWHLHLSDYIHSVAVCDVATYRYYANVEGSIMWKEHGRMPLRIANICLDYMRKLKSDDTYAMRYLLIHVGYMINIAGDEIDAIRSRVEEEMQCYPLLVRMAMRYVIIKPYVWQMERVVSFLMRCQNRKSFQK